MKMTDTAYQFVGFGMDATGRKAKFLLNVEQLVAAYLEDDLIICPHCGKNLVNPWVKAGTRFGICEPCYIRLKTDAQRQALETLEAQREYDSVRQKASRTRRNKAKNKD